MKPTPLHVIANRIKALSLPQQIFHLRALVALERPHSVRRNELESLLRGKLEKQLRKEGKAA